MAGSCVKQGKLCSTGDSVWERVKGEISIVAKGSYGRVPAHQCSHWSFSAWTAVPTVGLGLAEEGDSTVASNNLV